jgi:hypothetical protein
MVSGRHRLNPMHSLYLCGPSLISHIERHGDARDSNPNRVQP